MQNFEAVFAQTDTDIGRIPIEKHKIIITPHHPIQRQPYRRPQGDYDESDRQVNELKAKGLIRESSSPWAFPVTLADKKDGTKRLCVDYRPLNKITIDDKMPMPRIQDVFDRLAGSKFFTTLDVAWGFWHVAMEESSIPMTAFVTNSGHYEWLVLPFGLKNSPATFQRCIQRILGDLLYKGAINYLDDIIVYSDTFENHLTLLKEVFTRLLANNVKLKLKKCHFASDKVKYLGHTISCNQVRPSEEKTKAIKEFPIPDNVTKVQQFVGLANYFRNFVPDFTKLAKPLTLLTRKGVKFKFEEEELNAFKQLKEHLINEPILALYDPTKPCILHTDASKIGIGAILKQPGNDGIEHVVEYYSKRLNKAQENYTASELECLAVVESIEHFECYLNQRFTVITDHSALQWLLTFKKPKGRVYRWSVRLSAYSFDIIHKAGKKHQHVDALSRSPINLHLTTNDIITAQSSADLTFVKNPIIRNGVVTVKHHKLYKAVVPESLRLEICRMFHEDHSHPGQSKTLQMISAYYWWPTLLEDVKHHVQSCEHCQKSKLRNKPTLGHYMAPNANLEPLELIATDTIVMGVASRGNRKKYIQVIIDHHSRYVWAFATPTNTAQAITSILKRLIDSGLELKTILTDNYMSYKSKHFKDFIANNKMKHILCTAYHPQTQGMVERVNGTIIVKLRTALLEFPGAKWFQLLQNIVDDYNSTPHRITGFPPAYLLHARHSTPEYASPPISVEEARVLAKERTRKAILYRKTIHDGIHQHLELHPGQRVLKETPDNDPTRTKTSQEWKGPYFVIKQICPTTYDICETLSGTPIRAHISQLKLFVPREQTQQTGESIVND